MVKGTRGEGSEVLFLGKHLHALRVEEHGKRDTEEVRRGSSRSTNINKARSVVVLVGDFFSRIGKASHPNEGWTVWGRNKE